jgi:serine/threonine protein kinase
VDGGRAQFGKYVLLRRLASGGMGEVFLAKQQGPSGFEKLLVIKRMLPHHLDKPDYLEMFFSEAKLVARLNHNNVVQIHEMGEIDGDYYIAMEYVRGRSLRSLIDRLRMKGRMLPLPHVVELTLKLAEGLAHMHDARDLQGRSMNIIHRDLNPHNILVSYSGELKIIDFGIAKSSMDTRETSAGTIKGKFVYMSPEQSAAEPMDHRSDIFSLAIVCYELASLENPFVRQNVVLSLEAIQSRAVDYLSTRRPDAKALDRILARALEKRPEDRQPSAAAFRDELRGLLISGQVVPASQDLGQVMHELFVDDIAEEGRLLAQADQEAMQRQGSNPDAPLRVPTLDLDPVQGPSVFAAEPFSEDDPTQLGDDTEPPSGRRRKSSRSLRAEPLLASPDEISSSDEYAPAMHEQTRADRPPPVSEDVELDGPYAGSDFDTEMPYRSGAEVLDVPPPADDEFMVTQPHMARVRALNPTRFDRARRRTSAFKSRPRARKEGFMKATLRPFQEAYQLLEAPSLFRWRRVRRLVIYLFVLILTAVTGFWVTREFVGSARSRVVNQADAHLEARNDRMR